MYAARYWPSSYWAQRFWAHHGGTATVAVGAYTSPSVDDVILRTGLSSEIANQGEGGEEAFRTDLAALIPDAEARTALSVTEAIFDAATLTPHQVTLLQRSVCLRTGADYLLNVETTMTTGTNEPLNMEASLNFRQLAEHFERQAEELDFLVRVPRIEPNLLNPRERANVLAKQLELPRNTDTVRY